MGTGSGTGRVWDTMANVAGHRAAASEFDPSFTHDHIKVVFGQCLLLVLSALNNQQ